MHEKLLKLVLQGFGVFCCLAVVPLLMPTSWMAACHEWLGMGEFPDMPVAEYLARMTSGLCAFLGVLALLLASDIQRYAAAIRLLAISIGLLEVINLFYGLPSGMPAWWLWTDAVGAGGFAIAVIYLQQKINDAPSTSELE